MVEILPAPHLPALFDAYVPREIQRELLERCILKGYQEARDLCDGQFELPEIHDLLPHVRRAQIEKLLRALAKRHPAKLDVITDLNQTTNAYHVVVRGGPIRMTVSAVDTPQTVVREAEFRKTMARSYQLEFWDDSLPPPADGFVYALIIHGRSKDSSIAIPSFVRVVFPNRDCTSYIDGIDLLRRFRDLPELKQPIQVQSVDPDLRLRIRAREGEQA